MNKDRIMSIEGKSQITLPDGRVMPATVTTTNAGVLTINLDIFNEGTPALHKLIMEAMLSEQGLTIALVPWDTPLALPEPVKAEEAVTFGDILAKRGVSGETLRKRG